jgi:aryl-alcohol dehydrogenase-like predicted oxidoreductase
MNWLRPLGNTDMQVSALGLGTVKLGRDRGVRYPEPFAIPDHRSAAALLDSARDLGINLLDTAPAYGRSEERLGALLAGQREHWLLCTKVGEEFDGERSRFDFSPAHTRASIERSLRRLRTDVLDIALIHSDGRDLDIIRREGTLEALAEMKRAGLVRAIGMSTKSVEGGLAAAPKCDVLMVTLNAREPEGAAVLECCADLGRGVLVKKALASGHASPAQALPLALGQRGCSAVVVGTISPVHLRDNVETARDLVG